MSQLARLRGLLDRAVARRAPRHDIQNLERQIAALEPRDDADGIRIVPRLSTLTATDLAEAAGLLNTPFGAVFPLNEGLRVGDLLRVQPARGDGVAQALTATELEARRRAARNFYELRRIQGQGGLPSYVIDQCMCPLCRRYQSPERQEAAAVIEHTAERLLKDHLTPDQRAEYEDDRSFTVKGCNTGNRYRIKYGIQQNVFELDDKGREIMGWCFTPVGDLAPGDCMLAQKVALESDEENTLMWIANRSLIGPGLTFFPGGIVAVSPGP